MMNFILQSCSSLFLLLFLIACKSAAISQPTDTPEDAALYFINAVASGDFQRAKSVSDLSTQQFLEMMNAMSAQISIEEKLQSLQILDNISTVDCVDKAPGSTACWLCCYGGIESELQLDLVKKEGKWLVSMYKEDSKLDDLTLEHQK